MVSFMIAFLLFFFFFYLSVYFNGELHDSLGERTGQNNIRRPPVAILNEFRESDIAIDLCCAMWQIFGLYLDLTCENSTGERVDSKCGRGFNFLPPFPACPLQILQIVFLKRADGAEKVEKLLEGVRAGARRNRNDPCSSSCFSACIPFFAKTCLSILSSSAAFSSASASGPGASQFFCTASEILSGLFSPLALAQDFLCKQNPSTPFF